MTKRLNELAARTVGQLLGFIGAIIAIPIILSYDLYLLIRRATASRNHKIIGDI